MNKTAIKTFFKNLLELLFKILQKLGWRLVAGLSVSIGAIVLFGWLASEVFEGESKVFDETVRTAFQQIASPQLTKMMIFFTYLGSVYGIVILFLIAFIILLCLNKKRAAILLSITMVGEAVLGMILKISFKRQRPDAFFDFTLPTSYSFPSGHAFASLCFFGALAWIITSQTKNRNLSFAVWITAACLILIIGSSRIYLGVHYPSDILAGYLAGLIWLLTIYLADFRLRQKSLDQS